MNGKGIGWKKNELYEWRTEKREKRRNEWLIRKESKDGIKEQLKWERRGRI